MVPSVKLHILTTDKDAKHTNALADKQKQVEEGVCCLRYEWNDKRIWKSVGNDLKSALIATMTGTRTLASN